MLLTIKNFKTMQIEHLKKEVASSHNWCELVGLSRTLYWTNRFNVLLWKQGYNIIKDRFNNIKHPFPKENIDNVLVHL